MAGVNENEVYADVDPSLWEAATLADVAADPNAAAELAASLYESAQAGDVVSDSTQTAEKAASLGGDLLSATDVVADPSAGPERAATVVETPGVSGPSGAHALTDTGATVRETPGLQEVHHLVGPAEIDPGLVETPNLFHGAALVEGDTEAPTAEAAQLADVHRPHAVDTDPIVSDAPTLARAHTISEVDIDPAISDVVSVAPPAIIKTIAATETGAVISDVVTTFGVTSVGTHVVTDTDPAMDEAPTLVDMPAVAPSPPPAAAPVFGPRPVYPRFRRVTDFSLEFGGDLGSSCNGDFGVAQDAVLSRQRVIRRLVTNSRQIVAGGGILSPDYLYHPTYGESLGRKVGSDIGSTDALDIQSIVRAGLRAEDSVDQTQPVNANTSIVTGGMRLLISYTSAGKVITLPAIVVS